MPPRKELPTRTWPPPPPPLPRAIPPARGGNPSALPTVELTVRDFFRHFPSFEPRPVLQTHEERLALARAIVEEPASHAFEALPAALGRLIGHAEEQFEKLAALKGWRAGGSSHQKEMYGAHHRTFRQALNTTCARMASWARAELGDLRRRRTAGFFAAIESACPAYEYSPGIPPLREFERAAKAAGWSADQQKPQRVRLSDILSDRDPAHRAVTGTARIEQLALAKAGALVRFFTQAEKEAEGGAPAYRYNRAAYPPVELNRLCRLMAGTARWDAERNKRARQEFSRIYGFADPFAAYGLLETNTPIAGGRLKPRLAEKEVVDVDQSPMARFCRSFNNSRYTYEEQTPTDEFERIEYMVREATGYNRIARQWSSLIPESEYEEDEDTGRGGILPYWKSEVHLELQNRFYRTVEEHFDWLVDLQCRGTGLGRDEYVALFFQIDTQGKKTEDYNKAFAKLYINIYDFIDHLHELQLMTKRNLQGTRRGQNPGSRPLLTPKLPTKFPTEMHLGIYCERTGRIFNATAARQSGTLARLLRLVGQYFDYSTKARYCADLNKEFEKKKTVGEIDAMLLCFIGNGYIGPSCKYNPGRDIRITRPEPSLVMKYPQLFESVTKETE